MGFLKRFFGAEAPQWAQPISNADFREFQSDVTTSLQGKVSESEIDWQEGTVKVVALPKDRDLSTFNMYLQNLVVSWKDCVPVERKIHAADFVNRIVAGFTTSPPKLHDCLSQVMIRIYDNEFAETMGCIVSVDIGNYLKAGLVIDHGHTVISVSEKQFEESGMSVDELFEIAKRNLIEQDIPSVERQDGQHGLLTIFGSEVYGASQIMVLDQHTKKDETYWVATPTRDVTLLAHPKELSEDALWNFLTFAGKVSESSPNHYILPVVLEYRNGEFRDLCKKVENTLELI